MQLHDFDFELPPELIARYPLTERSASRLLVVSADTNENRHKHFTDIETLLEPGDLLIFNDTKVMSARLFGKKITGGRVEMLVERVVGDKELLAQMRASKALKEHDEILINETISFRVLGRKDAFYHLEILSDKYTVMQVIDECGEIPLPPYMHRSPEEIDKIRYQTVYANEKGSVAAPTAGLHFDQALIERLQDKHIQCAYLTLHVGAGTFAPIRVTDLALHQMHAEYFQISESVCEQIAATKAAGKKVVAVGTTTLRALESAVVGNQVKPFQGETRLFVSPGYKFHSADVLITNLHLPQSTLLMLVSAFGGYEEVMQAYQDALAENYRFYSYGDAMWINLKT